MESYGVRASVAMAVRKANSRHPANAMRVTRRGSTSSPRLTTPPAGTPSTARAAGTPRPFVVGFAAETQRFPDSPNRPQFPSARLDPGQTYRHAMRFDFTPAHDQAVDSGL